MWGYRWGYTAAEIDLLSIDQPIVVYDHKTDKKGKKEFRKARAVDTIKASNEWKAKYEGTDGKTKLDLSGFNFGGATDNTNTTKE